MAIFYSRTCLSSSLVDGYEACSDIPGTTFDLSIDQLGALGERVEGRFSGLVSNRQGPALSITNGTFSVLVGAPVVPPQRTNGAQQ